MPSSSGRLLRDLGELAPIYPCVGYFMGNDQVVRGIYRSLDVLADDA